MGGEDGRCLGENVMGRNVPPAGRASRGREGKGLEKSEGVMEAWDDCLVWESVASGL